MSQIKHAMKPSDPMRSLCGAAALNADNVAAKRNDVSCGRCLKALAAIGDKSKAAPAAKADLLNKAQAAKAAAGAAKRSPKSVDPHDCLCGCGQSLSSKSLFVQGHDMKAKSRIIGNLKSGIDRYAGCSDALIDYAKAHWGAYFVKYAA